MKNLILLLFSVAFAMNADAQGLSLKRKYGSSWVNEIVTLKNKPNGYIYRLRRDVQCNNLPPVAGDEYELFIAEPAGDGWIALWRLPMASNNYDFVVALYNQRKEVTGVYNLCDISNNRYCEVQDVRWDEDNGNILFNMACPSYASSINGKGSKLYCYNVIQDRIVWQTDYLVSNDIFIIEGDYVFCAYGFTNEKDYLFMLNKNTGEMYSRISIPKKVHYMEVQYKYGQKVLYVVDYDNNLSTYLINDRGSFNRPVKKKPVGMKR